MEQFRIEDPTAGIYLHRQFKIHEASAGLRYQQNAGGNLLKCSRVWVQYPLPPQ